MTFRLTAMLEFESEAQAVDAFNQMSARATNTRVVGMGGPSGYAWGSFVLTMQSWAECP